MLATSPVQDLTGDEGYDLPPEATNNIFEMTPESPPFFTWKGSSVTMIASLPWRSGSMWARAWIQPVSLGRICAGPI